MISEDIKAWSASVSQLASGIAEFIQNNPLPKMPSFDTVGNRKGLYESYATVVGLANDITPYLVEVQKLYLQRNAYKKVVRETIRSASLVVELNKILEEISESLTIADRMINSYKVAIDNQLRFYQSTQYILSSPRLNSYD